MHEANFPNRTLYVMDNLRVMRGMDSGSVDLIATDPPFNSKRSFNAPLGSRAAKQKFDDRWRWDEVTDEWHDLIAAGHPAIKEVIEAAIVIEGGTVSARGVQTGVKDSIAAFLAWMAPRVVEMRRVLKDTGSMYLHCDPAANSYLRLLLDAVFGRGNFRNEIVWKRTSGHSSAKRYGPVHDVLLFYSVSKSYKWNAIYQDYADDYVNDFYRLEDERGKYTTSDLTASGPREGESGSTWRGIDPSPRHWALPRKFPGSEQLPESPLAALDRLDEMGRVHWPKNGRIPRFKRYLEEMPGVKAQSLWTDIEPIASQSRERTGWATQKPLALYERIIEASSNEGDMILDPFAGCATTCVAAERLQRRWVGIDIDPVAETVTRNRLKSETGLFDFDGDPVTVRKSPPKRKDIESLSDDRLREVIWNNQGRRCGNYYCTSEGIRKEDLELDHRIPKSRGGSDGLDNRIGLCANCNRRKGAKAWGAFLDAERTKQPHPTR